MDKANIESLRKLGKSMLEDQPDRETFKNRILELFQFLSERSYNGLFRDDKELYEVARAHIIANVNVIYRRSESPIETLFLCSLILAGLDATPFFITITSPIVADEMPNLIYERHEQDERMFRAARKRGPDPDLELLAGVVESIQGLQKIARAFMSDHVEEVMKALGEDSIGTKLHQYLVGDISRCFHVSLQSTFKDIRVEERSIRPDVFIWSPRQRIKMIVECDGYAYHHDQKTFSKDRVRDRVLQQHGYQTFRFSGQEIFHDSVFKSFEFVEYLFSILPIPQTPGKEEQVTSKPRVQKHKSPAKKRGGKNHRKR